MFFLYTMICLIFVLPIVHGGDLADDKIISNTPFHETAFDALHGCGNWHETYTQMHNEIRNGTLPPRFLVNVAVEAGLADRLTGLITAFYYSLLTGRALVTVSYDTLPGFESAFDSPFIDWSDPGNIPESAIDPLKYTYMGQRGYRGPRIYNPKEVNTSQYLPMYLINDNPTELFGNTNLHKRNTKENSIPYLMYASNRGRSYRLFQNRFHKQDLFDMGLRNPDNGFLCAFSYLFKPNRVMAQLYQKTWEQFSDSSTLKIAIHIRTGDQVFASSSGDHFDVNDVRGQFKPFFDCAKEIEKTRRRSKKQKVLWYLMSDSKSLRVAAKTVFADKLITDIETKMIHPDCRFQNPDDCNETQMSFSMLHSGGDLLTYSLADYHVTHYMSGYSRIGAWLSGRWDNMYSISGRGNDRKCTIDALVSRSVSADEGAGI